MELDITDFFNATEDNASLYSASQMEAGENAGKLTWGAALGAAPGSGLLTTSDERREFEDFVRAVGAWEPEEVKGWSDDKCRALLIQMIAGDMREAELDCYSSDEDWAEYERRAEAGDISSRLFRGDDGRIYYYIGE